LQELANALLKLKQSGTLNAGPGLHPLFIWIFGTQQLCPDDQFQNTGLCINGLDAERFKIDQLKIDGASSFSSGIFLVKIYSFSLLFRTST
jgi:hypothetical protein